MYTAIFSRGLASEFRKFGEAEGDALAVAKTPRSIRAVKTQPQKESYAIALPHVARVSVRVFKALQLLPRLV